MDTMILIASTVLLSIILFGLVSKNRLGTSWEGEVVDKIEGYRGGILGTKAGVSNLFVLVIKKSDRTKVKMIVTKRVFEKFVVGDSIVKKWGHFNPQKLTNKYI